MQRPSLTSIKNESTSEQTTKYKSRSQNIKVIVRVRPTLKSEFGKEVAVSCSDNKKTVTIDTTTNTVQSTLDGAFDEITTQDEIFQQIKDSVPSVLQGFNSTIFAYGQTGSGKTHTMFGSDWENLMMRNNGGFVHNIQTTYVGNVETDKNFSGLIPRTINYLFQEIQKEENKPQNFAVYCSFLQIYNEKIYDLLTEKSSSNSLMIRENKMDGIYVDGLTEYCVSSFEECLMLMQRGEKNRYIRHTSNNVKSSRSHTIFQLIVESTKADSSGKLQKAKLNLCDLAGSEKLNKSEDIVNAHLTELKNINLSLTTLGKVIHNLSLGQKLPIPYRESKLTRLLQDSLGGNTKTCLIATLAPTLDYVDETLNTLKFAERAKHVVTEVKANKIEAVDAELVNKLQKEIKYLKEILNIRRKGTSAINEVNNKLLILQHENEKLRQSHFSINEVERLMEENKAIKLELQQLKCDSQSERNGDGDQREFDATGGLSNYTGKTFVPVNKSIFEPKGDILDQINEKGPRQRSGGSLQSRKSSNNEIRDKNQSENIDSMLTGGPMNLRMGRVISQDGPTKTYEETSSSIFKALPLRIKGKSATNLRKDQVKPPVVESLADLKRKEQMRSLKRLQNLEEWQRQIKEKELGYDSCQARYSAVPSMSELTAGGSTYSKLPKVAKQLDFDKLYDPYKVRQDIERKYNSLPRSHNPVRNLKATEEYSKFRNIERNYF